MVVFDANPLPLITHSRTASSESHHNNATIHVSKLYDNKKPVKVNSVRFSTEPATIIRNCIYTDKEKRKCFYQVRKQKSVLQPPTRRYYTSSLSIVQTFHSYCDCFAFLSGRAVRSSIRGKTVVYSRMIAYRPVYCLRGKDAMEKCGKKTRTLPSLDWKTFLVA